MLREPIATHRRSIAGNAAVATLVSIAAFAAWAAQPPVATLQQPPATTAKGVTLVKILPAADYVGEMRLAPPEYPKAALDAHVSGKVVLLIDVAANGSVADVQVESSQPAGVFDAATIEAVKKWRFTPSMKNGKPVAGRVRVPIEFRKD